MIINPFFCGFFFFCPEHTPSSTSVCNNGTTLKFPKVDSSFVEHSATESQKPTVLNPVGSSHSTVVTSFGTNTLLRFGVVSIFHFNGF